MNEMMPNAAARTAISLKNTENESCRFGQLSIAS